MDFMKSAYELAMERLNKQGPQTKVSAAQKKELAELDSRYAAKVAERELFLKDELAKAAAKGGGASKKAASKKPPAPAAKAQPKAKPKLKSVPGKKVHKKK